ncbi:TonB-dependent receptor [Dyadobacter bucti]|uniref:TonB-dependent receptor n=1 Tax=Dyadobacter bucti TaxID=2572203 RepID=UPI00110848DE|nr:TonB-dependent receptor [Dyadobacter bucti]
MNKKRRLESYGLSGRLSTRTTLSWRTFMMMKVFCILLLACLKLHAHSYSQSITLNAKGASIVDVFRSIEQQSGYVVLYNYKELRKSGPVTVAAKNMPLEQFLSRLFSNQPFTYKIEDKTILISPRLESLRRVPVNLPVEVQPIAPTERNVSGTVTDAEGGALPGVTVLAKGTSAGAATDVNGKYSLSVPDGTTVLAFTMVGYSPQEKEIGAASIIDVTMAASTSELSEVVVIGYGSRSAKDVTTAISRISAETIDKSVSMTPEMAMQGTMSGVQVSGNSGDPMMRPTIRIRGTNTWGVSDPLFVIDGIPVTEMGAGIEGENARIADVRGPINIMSMINPNDIESISVLKDASAAAIYGVRAANGVVLITTKTGRKGTMSVDFSTRLGVQNLTQEFDLLTTPEYTSFVQGIFATDPDRLPMEDNIGRFDPASDRYLGNSPTYNWQDAVRNKNAAIQDYSVRVSGGNENTDYNVSVGYANTQGTILINQLKRYSGSFKLNSKIKDWLKTGINYRLVNASGRDGVYSYFDVIRSAPWQPIYAGPGIPSYNGYANVVGGIQQDGTYSNQKLYGQGTRINEVGRMNSNDVSYDSWRNIGNMYVELTPLKHLTVKGTLSLDRYVTTRSQFSDYDANVFDYTAGDPRARGGGKSVGSYQERDVINNNLMKELMVNYANSFGDHNLDLLFNFSDQKYDAMYKFAGSEYMTTKKDYLRVLGGERAYTSVGSEQMRWALQGYLFRASYNYASKYYLDATVRRDGSARFAPENRWGTFPSVSAAWRLKSESFLESVSWLSDLKLRAGWGQLGNQEVRDMAYLSAISRNPHYAMGNSSQPDRPSSGVFYEGATIFGIPNRDLTWERTETFNIGFDAQLFKGLEFSAEYYYKKTHGILQAIDLPSSVGVIETPVANVAKVENQGFEFNLNWQQQLGNFRYGVGGNLTTTANRVLETYKGIPTSGGTVEQGYSMFYHRAYKVGGVFQSDEEAQQWLSRYEDVNYQRSRVGAGDFYFQDLRGAPKNENEFYSEGADGRIDSYDMVYVGKSIPGFFYGINGNASYKGFDFNIQFTGVGDVVKYNGIKAGTFMATEGDNVTREVYNAWTPENRSTTHPRLVFGDPVQNLRSSDFFFESAAYLRLQNVQLGYTIPQLGSDAGKKYFQTARIYAGASNLFTMTPYTGLDPENNNYPVPRTFFVGLTVKF